MSKNYGKYLINPAKKTRGRKKRSRGRRMRNPYGLVLVNPAKRASSSKRKPSRRKRRARAKVRRKAILSAPVQTKNPTMKSRRRGRRRSRNPSRRRSSRRRSSVVVIRNPARGRRRSRSRRMRNPVGGAVGEIFNSNTLTLGVGIVAAQVGTNLVLNKLRATEMATQGNLPGLKPGQESVLAIMLYKLVIGAGVGYLLRNQSPRFSQGMIIGSVAGALSDVLMQSRVLQTAGVAKNFYARPGMGMIPGTSTRFTGPAQRFLMNSNNVPRPGMGAAVRPGFVRAAQNQTEGAFRGAN